MINNNLRRLQKAVGALACCLLVAGVTAFSGRLAYADDVPAAGTGYGDAGSTNLETLPGAQGSQLGLFFINNFSPKSNIYPFMNLKFDPSNSTLTFYYAGGEEALNEVSPFGGSQYNGQVDINFPNEVSGQWLYTPPTGFNYADPGTVNSSTVSIQNGETFSIQYYEGYLLHSYSSGDSVVKCDPDTFNTAITRNSVAADGTETQINNGASNTINFEIQNNTIYETGPSSESVTFKNGASIDFNPYSGTFSIQKGSGSPDTSVKVASTSTGSVLSTPSMDEDSYNNPFSPGSQVEISTTSSNPITSEKNTSSGSVTSASDLSLQGWNLEGDNTVVNRYNSVQLVWQPTASDLPTYRYMLYKYLGSANYSDLMTHYPDFFRWLMADPEALNQFLTSGYASTSTIGGMGAYLWGTTEDPSSELAALEIWAKIWRAYPDSRGGEDMKIAIAVSLDCAHNVIAWLPGKPVNPLGRYEIYASAFADGTLTEAFVNYSTQMLRDVVDDRISNAGLKWLRSYILNHESAYYTFPSLTYMGYTLIKYLGYSPYAFVQDGGYYGPKATIWNLMRYGGACGANSKFSVFLLNALGEAGWAVGQTGHCAYVYFYQGKWNLGYNKSGWGTQVINNYRYNTAYSASNIPLMFVGTQLNANQFSKDKSYLLTFEAEGDMAQGNYDAALSDLKQAVSIAPSNIASWQAYIQAANYLKETSGLANQIKSAFDTLQAGAPYIMPGSVPPMNGPINYDNIISSLTSQIKS